MEKIIFKSVCNLALTIFFFSCTNQNPISNSINNSIDIVDLIKAYKSKSEVLLSQVAEKIEYIPLESLPTCMLDKAYTIAANDSMIIIIAFRKILVFERSTGIFKYEISSYGRGPNEYLYTFYHTSYYEPDNMIFVGKNLNDIIQGFSSDGILGKTFKLPTQDIDNGYLLESPWPYHQNTYLGYSINYSGINPFKIEEFDSTGKVLNRYPNYNRFDSKKYSHSNRSNFPDCFFNFKDSVRFFEPLTDSIFTVLDNKLIPRYKISMGEAIPPYFLQGINYYSDYEHFKYFWLSTFQETSRFLFFTTETNAFSHLCFYDKKQKRTWVCENFEDKDYYKFNLTPPRLFRRIRTIGLMNDLDNFVPVGTGYGELYINRSNEMAVYILASDVERWFKMNPDKAKLLPEELKKFSRINPTDNIIVLILKLKT